MHPPTSPKILPVPSPPDGSGVVVGLSMALVDVVVVSPRSPVSVAVVFNNGVVMRGVVGRDVVGVSVVVVELRVAVVFVAAPWVVVVVVLVDVVGTIGTRREVVVVVLTGGVAVVVVRTGVVLVLGMILWRATRAWADRC